MENEFNSFITFSDKKVLSVQFDDSIKIYQVLYFHNFDDFRMAVWSVKFGTIA